MEAPTRTEPTTFLERALPYAERGIRVFPLMPCEKRPPASMTAWPELATTDLAQISAWNEENPDYNCALMALQGQFLILEFDIKGGMKAAAAEMQQPFPNTRIHISGKGFGHYVFRATAYSDRLGNRQANRPEGGEWFSFRTHNRYVVGPGSIHPNGNKYKVARDVDPIQVPDWVCDWVEKNSKASATPADIVSVSSDFDFDGFLDHYGIEVHSTKDNWYTTTVCPIASRRHQHSVATGFYYDGNSLGWNCFAQGCEGSEMSIGQVIRRLNKDHEPYTGIIWDQHDAVRDDFADDADEDELTRPVKAQELAAPFLSVEELVAATGGMIGRDPDAEPAQFKEPSVARSNFSVDGNLFELLEGIAPPRPLPVPASVATSVVPLIGLSFDPRALYGKLGELAEHLCRGGIPLGYGYPAILTVASVLDDVEDIDHNVRNNIYTALLGDVGSGKSAAVQAAIRSILLPKGAVDKVTPSSDRGLANQCGGLGKRKLLVQDEYRATLQKCNIQGSSLPQLFNALWNDDTAGSADKKGVELCSARLSVLGNLTCKDSAEFAKLFGASSVSGMVDRHLFGWHDSNYKYRPLASMHPEIIRPKPVWVPNWVWDAKDQWLGEIQERRRLSEHVLRVALIQSCCNGDPEITQASFEAALRFGEWQERIRQTYRPGLGENNDAICFEAVYRALCDALESQTVSSRPHPDAHYLASDTKEQCKLLHFTSIINGKSYYRRFGAILLNRVKTGMVHENLLKEVFEEEEDPSGSGQTKKGKKTPFVKLTKRIR